MSNSFMSDQSKHYLIRRDSSIEELIYNSQVIARLSGQSIYVMDCCCLKFLFVSDNPLFLCGYTPRNVVRMSFLFYKKIVHPDDRDMIMNISIEALKVFSQYPKDECIRLVMSYNFRITNPFNGQTTMIDHSFIPMYFTSDGKISTGICLVRPSTEILSGHAFIKKDGITPLYTYTGDDGWITVKNKITVTLTEREKEILRVTIQGYNNYEIASVLSIDINTVKSHKKNIFKKLKVNNIAEAIIYATNNNFF